MNFPKILATLSFAAAVIGGTLVAPSKAHADMSRWTPPGSDFQKRPDPGPWAPMNHRR